MIAAMLAAAALGPPVTIAGPSAAITAVDGVSLAADGSGAVVYRETVNGVVHVFVSLEHGGSWAPGVQVDPGVAAGASAASVAAGADGRVAVAWIAGGTLYDAVDAGGTAAFTAPQPLGAAAGQPALGIGISGTAYLAYAAPDTGGSDVDVARLDRSATSFVALGALTAAPAALSGSPVLTVAADATAVVAWTQAVGGVTHVMIRRASGAGPSPVLDDATVPSLGGVAGGAADSPQVGVEFDSSNAWVAFRETFGTSSRLIVDELLGDELRPPLPADSLGSAAGSASAPSLAVGGNGAGLLAGQIAPSGALTIAALGTRAQPFAWTPGAIAAPASVSAPLCAASASGTGAVVYAPQAGALDAQLFANGVAAGAPLALSGAALGAVASVGGVATDNRGDVVVAYLAGQSVVVRPLVAPLGAPRALGTELWIGQSRPLLSWQAAPSSWGSVSYTVYVDGARVGTTTATSFRPPPIADGRHSWSVTATDSLGGRSASLTRRLLIDAATPVLRISISGRRTAGTALTFRVSVGAISGVRAVTIAFGDGARAHSSIAGHAYAATGVYTITVSAMDRAGVSVSAQEEVHIK
ncbi:MAG TPA: PKD domain-containing protein [Solirubrobacteraceae bacterium]|nr:PKD domain-containing protein [Solirubrobacteraceae bacterium]